jgi:hypothetical protein
MDNILDKYDRELKELYGLESLPLGLKEIFKSAPQHIGIPRGLLDWSRQFYIEGIKAGYEPSALEVVIRTKAIEGWYSSQQVEATLERIRLELQNTSKAQEQFKLISRN